MKTTEQIREIKILGTDDDVVLTPKNEESREVLSLKKIFKYSKLIKIRERFCMNLEV